MPCPIHIWVPLMAAAAPVARLVHRRLTDWREPEPKDRPARSVRRWEPVGAAGASSRGAPNGGQKRRRRPPPSSA